MLRLWSQNGSKTNGLWGSYKVQYMALPCIHFFLSNIPSPIPSYLPMSIHLSLFFPDSDAFLLFQNFYSNVSSFLLAADLILRVLKIKSMASREKVVWWSDSRPKREISPQILPPSFPMYTHLVRNTSSERGKNRPVSEVYLSISFEWCPKWHDPTCFVARKRESLDLRLIFFFSSGPLTSDIWTKRGGARKFWPILSLLWGSSKVQFDASWENSFSARRGTWKYSLCKILFYVVVFFLCR